MNRDELRLLLNATTDEEFIRDRLLGTPWVFRERAAEYHAWRTALAATTGHENVTVHLVGSAATGYSLNPGKLCRDFRPVATDADYISDLDIAVICAAAYFDAWNLIVTRDQQRTLGFSEEERLRIRQDIYWGYVSSSFVPRGTGPARLLRDMIAASTRSIPLRGHRAKIRVYRRDEDFHAYHMYSLRVVRHALRH